MYVEFPPLPLPCSSHVVSSFRLSRSNGSGENTFEVASVTVKNCMAGERFSEAIYRLKETSSVDHNAMMRCA